MKQNQRNEFQLFDALFTIKTSWVTKIVVFKNWIRVPPKADSLQRKENGPHTLLSLEVLLNIALHFE